LLGEVNVDILLSRTPSPEKEEYIVKPGDVLQKVAHKVKSTPELIMRMNNMSSTMLHIGERLLVSHPRFRHRRSAQTETAGSSQSRRLFQTISFARGKIAGQGPVQSHDQGRRSDGMEWR